MAKLASTTEPVRFVPDGQEDLPDPERAAYTVTPATMYSSMKFRHALRSRGLVYHGQLALIALMRRAIGDIFAGELEEEDRTAHLEILDNWEAAVSGDINDISPELIAQTDELEQIITRHYPAYSERLADNQLYLEMQELEAFRFFCTGWENAGIDYVRGKDGIAERLVEQLPEDHVRTAGRHALLLMIPSEGEAKNFDSPSPGT